MIVTGVYDIVWLTYSLPNTNCGKLINIDEVKPQRNY